MSRQSGGGPERGGSKVGHSPLPRQRTCHAPGETTGLLAHGVKDMADGDWLNFGGKFCCQIKLRQFRLSGVVQKLMWNILLAKRQMNKFSNNKQS